MWTKEIPKPTPTKPEASAECDKIHLKVQPAYGTDDGRLWQWFDCSFGVHSTASLDACCEIWPREAIRLAREQLDKLEAQLETGKTGES